MQEMQRRRREISGLNDSPVEESLGAPTLRNGPLSVAVKNNKGGREKGWVS